ncbi:MAG: class I SAM-dependent methyltransferase [Flavobacterium sp.]|uniref:class I SAM-dependent methyltransferase n=1 Tax=Flavobacterium sp. TaxID=239 RepID=UPI001223A7A0|nr:class I SAM-dependent methyltransferase [Flavobacterium sp.]RZJ67907.1 MAG: class I SAM-dependent methyltransferase [Flavobacterium sp.]
MNCKICASPSQKIFTKKVLYKYDVAYFQCPSCDFGQTEEPYWLDEAYISSMNLSDTGVMLRSERMSKITTSLICLFFKTRGQFLDYAGGFGAYVRTMRDIGFDFYWADPYTKNELARGFDGSLDRKYDIVTTFESFEHFKDPLPEIEKILALTDTIIFTTDPVPANPIPKDWWYIAPEHGQHVAFHSRKSLAFTAKKYGMRYYYTANVHILTKKKLNPLGALFLKLPFSKHMLYAAYFIFTPFLKSKSVSDMNSFYIKDNRS